MSYSEQDYIDALTQAAEIIGHAPTSDEYVSVRGQLDVSPSYSCIYNNVGGWNKAKELAGLETWGAHERISDVPQNVDIGQQEWEDLDSNRRAHIKRKHYLSKEKVERGCKKCGYADNPAAMEFHHPDQDRELSVSQNGWSLENLKNEVDKCVVLCGNCHNIEHREKDYLTF